ncbi:hypothetical protein CRG98_024823 [Punica granatum]|uniref:Uncharacterized protein n=1 Tax=Punica granatum TaxID=22663 RepID=A0A2I0JEZ6_PUNGR|nr:hypothetical protein CRG98_024823 [Punica granatum]
MVGNKSFVRRDISVPYSTCKYSRDIEHPVERSESTPLVSPEDSYSIPYKKGNRGGGSSTRGKATRVGERSSVGDPCPSSPDSRERECSGAQHLEGRSQARKLPPELLRLCSLYSKERKWWELR